MTIDELLFFKILIIILKALLVHIIIYLSRTVFMNYHIKVHNQNEFYFEKCDPFLCFYNVTIIKNLSYLL